MRAEKSVEVVENTIDIDKIPDDFINFLAKFCCEKYKKLSSDPEFIEKNNKRQVNRAVGKEVGL